MTSSYASYLVETLLMLACVCGAAWVILFGARKFGLGRARGPVSLVGQLPLDARRSIFLVRVGKAVLIVGASEAGLTKLGEVPSSDLPTGESEPAPLLFKDVLAKAFGKGGGSSERDGSEPPKGDAS